MDNINEPLFGVNNFNSPKIMKESQSIATAVLMILFGKPGFYPSIPELGMDIHSYLYSFEDEIDVDAIRSQLAYQCTLIKELLVDGSMTVEKKIYKEKPILLFTIPMEMYSTSNQLIIGVTTDDSGSVLYNFKLMESNF